MDQPRIHVRGKKEQPEKQTKQADTLNWNGPQERPLPPEPVQPAKRVRKVDNWSPYLKQRRTRYRHRPSPAKAESKRQDKPQQSLIKLIASGGSAIFVGTLMGFLILKVFVSGGVPEQSNSIDSHIGEPVQPAKSEQGEDTGDEAVILPEMNTVWVQGGVYSTREGADELANAQRDRGLAAVVNQVDDQYRVFFGVGMTRDDALNIASEIKDSGVDVYLKDDFSNAAVSLGEIPEEQGQKLRQLAEAGQTIINGLATLSTAGVSGEDITNEWASEMENVEQTHRTFLSALGEVKQGLSDHQLQALNAMDQGLAQAVEAAKQYNRETSVPYLWQVQEGIMQYLNAYRNLGSAD